jgi:hypothetical protein
MRYLTRLSVLVVCLGMGVAVLTRGADEKKNQSTFVMQLVDESTIACEFSLAELPFATDFAEMTIPVSRIDRITWEHDQQATVLCFSNKDQLRGKLKLDQVDIETVLGTLTVPTEKIVWLGRREAMKPVYEDSPAKRRTCINHLRMIDAGKEQWAMENTKKDGDPVDIDGVNEYIKGNATPKCPAGGTYKYGLIGSDPTCSVPGHKLSGW